MLAVNGHAKHRQSLCRVGYGKTALSMELFFITTANILSTHTFLLLSQKKVEQTLYFTVVYVLFPLSTLECQVYLVEFVAELLVGFGKVCNGLACVEHCRVVPVAYVLSNLRG